MQQLPYSSLNESQRNQVAYLFADSHFGTDVNAYLYEVGTRGEVKGRTSDGRPLTVDRKRAKHNSQVKVTVIKEAQVTDEMIAHAHMSASAFAADIAKIILQSESIKQEVNT